MFLERESKVPSPQIELLDTTKILNPGDFPDQVASQVEHLQSKQPCDDEEEEDGKEDGDGIVDNKHLQLCQPLKAGYRTDPSSWYFHKKNQHFAVCSIQNIRIFVIDEERPQKNLTKSLNSQGIRRCSGNISWVLKEAVSAYFLQYFVKIFVARDLDICGT